MSLPLSRLSAIANGDAAALTKARAQIDQLRQELLQLKAKDEEFVAMAISKSFGDANDIDLTSTNGAPLRDRLRFWLLRYADLEATLWFEHLCCGLLSPSAEDDFEQLNPFLDRAKAAGLLSRLTQMMLVAGRVIQTCRALDSCHDLAQLLANPESAGSAVALAAGLGEKALLLLACLFGEVGLGLGCGLYFLQANVLCGLLASKRTYIEKKEGGTGFVGSFDPHFLVFEFVTGFLLRPRQVEMVNEFSDALRTGKSSVKQMIMGAGKTSVVSPLLALMHASGSRIVCLVVPPALISLSRSVLQNCFSTVVQKRVSTFKCDRSLDLEVLCTFRGRYRTPASVRYTALARCCANMAGTCFPFSRACRALERAIMFESYRTAVRMSCPVFAVHVGTLLVSTDPRQCKIMAMVNHAMTRVREQHAHSANIAKCSSFSRDGKVLPTFV
ncbi:unnamed protein product [Symbiodinium natans]|uniref:ubiquitinyl hydrolase 1 n=1 Tax=Symbiodinium natans TaxID=878477 RepID=A0A812SLQ4_9DINO|nr:unnamed protein product [Symbiodinium natans]